METCDSHGTSVVPIHRLPNEVLVEIMLISRPARIKFFDFDGTGEPFLWLPLTLVCRQWAELAYSTAKLWRTIHIGPNMRWVDLALACSDGSSPLDIYLPGLSVDGIQEKHTDALSLLLSHDMRQLMSVYLQHPKDSDNLHKEARAIPMRVASHLLSRLREIHCDGLLLPWDIELFSRLRSLTLINCRFDNPPTLASFTLRLDRTLSSLSRQTESKSGVMTEHLPYLRELYLRDDPSCVAAFLVHANFPKATQTSLTGDIHVHDYPDHITVPAPPLTSLLSPNCEVDNWHFLLCESRRLTLRLNARCTTTFEPDFSSCIQEIVSSFDLTATTSLNVRGIVKDTTLQAWQMLFARLPVLKKIKVKERGTHIGGFFDAFYLLHADVPAGAQVACPQLQHIVISGIRWGPAVMKEFEVCLRLRAKRGAPLASLKIEFAKPMYEDLGKVQARYAALLCHIVPGFKLKLKEPYPRH
ncbi:hypothetical protein OH76DRAFT_1558796 [Lentinus brumalis]|uniref:F-box domain-containing protein n=1 Tax=Lentinus brumalis TaxID=2498619 RepID=A0A371D0A2_9APHY|nr:hypothetical protein OH76DRAFT_1558796 [Polyporus brumalis]